LVVAIDLTCRACTLAVGTHASIGARGATRPTVARRVERLTVGAHALAIGAGRVRGTHDPTRTTVGAIRRHGAALVIAVNLPRWASAGPVGTHPPIRTGRTTRPAVAIGVQL